jgi:hypothetical protein
MKDWGLTPRNYTNFCHHKSNQSGAKALPSIVDSLKRIIIQRGKVLKFRSVSSSLSSPPRPSPPKIPTSTVSSIFPGKVDVPVSALQTLSGASPPDFEDSFRTGRAITGFGSFSSLCVTGQLTL